MGNSASCAPSMASNGAPKVLSLDGRLQSFSKPVTAAELMIEHSGKFLCDSSDLKVGHRIQGLLPDEDLEWRRLYFLLPMDLLYSVLTLEEMSSLTFIATKALKQGNSSGFGRIFPVLISEFCNSPADVKGLKLEDDDDRENQSSKAVKRLMSKQRSWKPALETIAETSCT
ncbi:uncharacterized protein LOC101203132 [Cucumis sativus]|uniref:Uncharacterized protein n=1 Tax=Cucumis sativus TaxID=3659 RepID=A0A0A0LSX3_CUCSA|nr:uncharacterized protein LOC101203132 [Cucumis sativus]